MSAIYELCKELEARGPDVCCKRTEPGWWSVFGFDVCDEFDDKEQPAICQMLVCLQSGDGVTLHAWGGGYACAGRGDARPREDNGSTSGSQAIAVALLRLLANEGVAQEPYSEANDYGLPPYEEPTSAAVAQDGGEVMASKVLEGLVRWRLITRGTLTDGNGNVIREANTEFYKVNDVRAALSSQENLTGEIVKAATILLNEISNGEGISVGAVEALESAVLGLGL